MKKLLKLTGITIALTAIGVAVKAKGKKTTGSINDTNVINLDLADLDSAPFQELSAHQISRRL